jgi:hypothetical protein
LLSHRCACLPLQGTDDGALDYALNRALDAYYNDRAWFHSLQKRVMLQVRCKGAGLGGGGAGSCGPARRAALPCCMRVQEAGMLAVVASVGYTW